MNEEEQIATENLIITPMDQGRWPLMEVESQVCEFPLSETDVNQIAKMDEMLTDLGDEAAGLAAVQIGYPRRIFVLNFGGENRVFINPRVLSRSKSTKKQYEACLSLPGLGGTFARSKSVELEYYSMDGEVKTETFKGFWARAVMHEMDHLGGILILNRLQEQHKEPVNVRSPNNKKRVKRRRNRCNDLKCLTRLKPREQR